MPGHRLPPLNALRAFEAVARNMSVKHAAAELCVTPGAVSQMLRVLEDHFGVRLFRRLNRGMLLTDAGQGLLPPVRNAFRQISDAARRVTPVADSAVLTVSATPFFAAVWLVPRLAGFQALHPEIDLHVVTGTGLADFARGSIDVAVRHGGGRYPGLRSDHVLAVGIVPVAAPELVARLGVPTNPADLLRWPIVQDTGRMGWQLWFEAQEISDAHNLRGAAYDDAALLYQAVLAGQGAGLLPAAMVAADVGEGRLVRLAGDLLLRDFAYYLVCPADIQDTPKVAAFRSWLVQAACASARLGANDREAAPTSVNQDFRLASGGPTF